MKKISETSKVFLIVLFSLWFIALPAYLHFSTLDNSDLNPPYPCLRSIDQAGSVLGSKKKEKILQSPFLGEHTFMAHLSPMRGPNCFYQLPTMTLKTPILRC